MAGFAPSTTRSGSEGGAHPGHAGGYHLGQGLSRDRHGGRCLSGPRCPLLCRDTGGERHPCVYMTPWPISRVLALVLFLALSIEMRTSAAGGAVTVEQVKRRTASRIPLQRYGAPEEVARMMLFLASDESIFCTGGVYMVDVCMSAGPS